MKKKRIQNRWIALALVAVMIFGLCACGSGSKSAANAGGGMMKEELAMDTADMAAAPSEMAGSYDAGAMAESGEVDAAAMSETGEADGAAGDGETLPPSEGNVSQKLIKNMDMTVETTEYDQFLAGVKQKVEALGGYVESSETSGAADTGSSRWGYMTLRIPVDKLDGFIEQVEDNSNVTYKSERVQDVTLSYVDLESHVNALRIEQETLMGMLAQATELETVLAIQNQLTNVRYEIESYESQLRVMDNQVSYSTVYLNINEVERETSGEGSTFGEEVKNRLGDNMYRMGQNFREFAIGFLAALPMIIIWVVVIVVVIIVIRVVIKKIKRRKEKQYVNHKFTSAEEEKRDEEKK